MNKFILHHYEFSPYSEKVRRMLDYAGISWQSVIHKEMPPRKELSMLVGGYERIPVAQVGADLFCDSNLIAEEIAVLGNKPELSFFSASQEVQDFVTHVEGKIFFAGVLAGSSPALRKKVMKQMSLWDLLRFFIDRLNMARTAKTDNMIKPGEAKSIIMSHLADMEDRLKQDFLFGSHPNIADFSAYHSLWFVRDLGECHFVADYPRVCAWMDRLRSCGMSSMEWVDKQYALDVAMNNSPRHFVSSSQLNKEISVTPADYRHKPTTGRLVFEDLHRWVLRREHPQIGMVNVHFPKRNYQKKLLA